MKFCAGGASTGKIGRWNSWSSRWSRCLTCWRGSEDQRRRLTSLLRTVLDCGRILPFDHMTSWWRRAGWLVLRFTYHQVVFEPEWVIATIREALRQRGFVPIDRQ